MPISLLQKRKISGKGVLRLSPEDRGRKYYRLYLDVIRRPKNEFINLNWNPPRGKYAFVSFLKDNRVLSRFALESLNEELQFIADISGQAQLMIKCALDTNNQTAINLGLALGAPPIEVTNPIAEFAELDIGWDEARIVCYAETAIEAALWGMKYDVCEESDERPDPGGPPVIPPPPLPPGEPILDINEPYNENTSDDGNTSPHPLDDTSEPPPPVSNETPGVRKVTTTVYKTPEYGGGTQVHVIYCNIPYHYEVDEYTIYLYTYVESFPGSGVMLETQHVYASGGQPGPSSYLRFTVEDELGYIAERRPLRP